MNNGEGKMEKPGGKSLAAYLLLLMVSLTLINLYGCKEKKQSEVTDVGLSAEERGLAVQIANKAIEEAGLKTDSLIYVANVVWVQGKSAEKKEGEQAQKALVTHYRYKGDLTIESLVNITDREVVQIDTAAHLSTPLSKEEFKIARELALSDKDVLKKLGEYKDSVKVEPLLLAITSREDSLFGHRVVRLLFKVERGYLSKPVVYVDLTERTVHVISKENQREY